MTELLYPEGTGDTFPTESFDYSDHELELLILQVQVQALRIVAESDDPQVLREAGLDATKVGKSSGAIPII